MSNHNSMEEGPSPSLSTTDHLKTICISAGLAYSGIAAYLDDIIIFSNTWEDHLLHL